MYTNYSLCTRCGYIVKRCKKVVRRERRVILNPKMSVWNNYQFTSNDNLLKKLKATSDFIDSRVRSTVEVNLVSTSGKGILMSQSRGSIYMPYTHTPEVNSSIEYFSLVNSRHEFAFTYITKELSSSLYGWKYSLVPFGINIRKKLTRKLETKALKLQRRRRRYRRRIRERFWHFRYSSWRYHRGYTAIDLKKSLVFNKNNKFILHYLNSRLPYSR